MKRTTLTIHIDIDFKFWAILPCLNINLNFPHLEFEWLCLGIYVSKKKKPLEIVSYGLPYWGEIEVSDWPKPNTHEDNLVSRG